MNENKFVITVMLDVWYPTRMKKKIQLIHYGKLGQTIRYLTAKYSYK